MRKMLMEFPDFGSEMVIEMDEENHELVDEVWNALPFTCVQEHGMVSGEMIYCWVPVLSEAPIRHKLRHTESPVGVVNYSQGTGNKIIIKYGECNEDLFAPVLGLVQPQYLDDLKHIGREIWFNYFNGKKIYLVKFSKLVEE